MLDRSAPDAPPTFALTATEIAVLDRFVNDRPKARQTRLSHYLIKIARLRLSRRTSDPPPGNTFIWRGLSRLTDIALGAMLRGEVMGIESLNGGIPVPSRRTWAMVEIFCGSTDVPVNGSSPMAQPIR